MKKVSAPFLFLIFCLLVFVLTRWKIPTPALYAPLGLGLILIFRSSLMDGLLIVLGYLSVEGAFKLLSGGSTGLRVSIDILIIALFLRHLQIQLVAKSPRKIFEAPLAVLFFIHAGWILVQYVNPHSLGLLPSIAAFKVYISSLLLYFIAFTALETSEQLRKMMIVCTVLAITQMLMTHYHFIIGEQGLLAWSHHYLGAMSDRFRGLKFRPFGMSNVAGGSSTMLYLLTPMALALCLSSKRFLTNSMGALLFVGSGVALMFTQVRSAQVKCAIAVGLLLALALLNKRLKSSLTTLLALGAIAYGASFYFNLDDPRLQVAINRTNTLGNFSEVWSDRSQGVYETTIEIVKRAPFGIGLSRVGAASEPFKDRIRADTAFGDFWSFADNLYKALLIEIGIPGLLAYTSFLFATIALGAYGLMSSGRRSDHVLFFQGAALGAVLAACSGHLGSEGFLYQPESSITWIFVGSLVKLSRVHLEGEFLNDSEV